MSNAKIIGLGLLVSAGIGFLVGYLIDYWLIGFIAGAGIAIGVLMGVKPFKRTPKA